MCWFYSCVCFKLQALGMTTVLAKAPWCNGETYAVKQMSNKQRLLDEITENLNFLPI